MSSRPSKPRSALRKVCAVSMAGALAACVNTSTIPEGLGIPEANAPQLFSVATDTTRLLDCLSGEIHAAGGDARKTTVFLTPLANTAGPKVGRIELPAKLEPFARASLDRISSGLTVVADEAKADLRLSGSLYAASGFRVLEGDLEALGFGLGAHVEAADVGLQLYLEGRPTKRGFEQSGTGVTVSLRLYSAEQGSSAFRVTSGSNGVVMARTRAAQEATPNIAIQSTINLAVALLVRARAAREWGVASSCQFGLAGERAINSETTPLRTPLLTMRLMLDPQAGGRLCAAMKPRGPLPAALSSDGLLLRVSEYRAEGIPIRQRTTVIGSIDTLLSSQTAVCLPRRAFDERTEQVQYEVRDRNGRSLGSAGYFFQ